MSKTYRVEIYGVKEGFAKAAVAGELATLFKKSAADVAALLEKRGTVVKKGVDLATAKKYQDALERRGCSCSVEPEGVFSADATQILPRYSPDMQPVTPQEAAAMQLQEVERRPEPVPAAPPPSPMATNPYAMPRADVTDSREDDETIRSVAKYQRFVLMSILASFTSNAVARASPGLFAALLVIAVAIFSIWAIYRLCRALELSAVLWVIVMFIPLFNLIGMLYINQKATRFLKEQGLSVGLMGAKI